MLKNFRVEELVSEDIYKVLGDNSWKLFDKDFLAGVDRFVSDLKKDLGVESVIVNDWLWEGGYSQSGFRELTSLVGAPKSAHKQGMALDLKFKGCTVEQAFRYLLDNQGRYDSVTRVENIDHTPTWLHVDCRGVEYLGIYVFNP